MPDHTGSGAAAASRIEFPCLYPIKIIGRAEADFRASVVATVERHVGHVDASLIRARSSRHRNYLALTVTIAATDAEQIRAIFVDLKKLDTVRMVL